MIIILSTLYAFTQITLCKVDITVTPFYKIIPDIDAPKVWFWEVEPRPLIHHDVHTTSPDEYSIGKKQQLVITHFHKSLLSHLKFQ